MIGASYGALTVVELADGGRLAIARCECGTVVRRALYQVRRGGSCGCWLRRPRGSNAAAGERKRAALAPTVLAYDAEGASAASIALALGVSRQTVRRVLREHGYGDGTTKPRHRPKPGQGVVG